MQRVSRRLRFRYAVVIAAAGAALSIPELYSAPHQQEAHANVPTPAGRLVTSPVTARAERPLVAQKVSPGVAVRQRVSRAEIADGHKVLDRIARLSKRGEKAVEFRRLLLTALAAPTKAEYQQIMRPFHERRNRPPTPPLGRNEPQERSSGPSAAAADCTTDYLGEHFVDECATSQEVDDAAAELDALEGEINADQSEQMGACFDNAQDPNECWATDQNQFATHAVAGATEYAWASTTLLDGAFDAAGCDGAAPDVSGVALAGSKADCISNAVAATIGAAYWVAENEGFKAFFGQNLARSMLNWGHAKLVLGALAVGYLVGSAISCWME